MASTIDGAKRRADTTTSTAQDVADGPGSAVRQKEIVIETFEDTLWWLETLTAMLLDGDATGPTHRLAPSCLLERMHHVLDVLREQIGSRRLALRALAGASAPVLATRAGQLELDYRALAPLIGRVEICAGRVAAGCPEAATHHTNDLTLTWSVTQLVDFIQLALLGEQELVLLMHTHYAGEGPP